MAKKAGHTCIAPVPALVQLRCLETDLLKGIAGVRADSRVRILCDGRETDVERGELQLTEYGISGIPIFQLSRDVNYLLRDRKTVMAEIDFLPDMTEESYENMKKTRRMLQEKRTAEEFFTGILNKKLMSVFLKIAGIKPTTPAVEIPEDKINTFYELCRCFRLHITESNPYENAQVSAGGIAVTEVTEDMESKLCPGLYFAGEILDVDGRCGGYNLQWAWSSGFIAGCSAAIKTE
ncbi:MAG: aminoacetone oxidase family FAD-binding enzyme [Lachnospiraceae bacterium]